MLKKNQLLLMVGVFLSFFINLVLMISIHLSWDESMQKYLPLQAEIKELKSDLAEAHLWFEEAVAGDVSIDIQKDVFIPLQHKSFSLYLANVESDFVSDEDIVYLNHLKSIEKKLENFYKIAQGRWLDSQKHAVGSTLDQEFDSGFRNIIKSIDMLTLLVGENIQADIEFKDNSFKWLIGFFLLMNFSVIAILFSTKKEQRRYELSLFEEKEKAVVTLRSIGDAVIITDLNGNITFLNQMAEKLTEKTSEEVEGLHVDEVLDLWNMKSGKKIKTPIHNVLYNNLTKLISNGIELVSKSGKKYIISDSVAPVKDKNGKILGAVLVFQDDTQKHREEKKLQESYHFNQELKKRMELALLGNKDGVWDWDVVSNEVYFSPRWKEMIGYSDNELKNEFPTWESRVHPDDLEAIMSGLQDNMDGKTEYYEGVHRMKHKDGHWVWILDRGKAIFDDDGKPIRMAGTHTDVSADKELEFKSAQRGKILDNSTNEIFIFDAQTYKFLYINKGAQKNIGYSLEEMLNMTPLDIKPKLDLIAFSDLLKPITKEGKENIEFSTLHQRKDGSRYDVDIYLQPTNFEGHDAYVAFILDITQKKEMEDRLLIQSRMAQMGEMISMIAHQWKQPLSAIAATTINMQLRIRLEEFDLDTKDGQEKQSASFLKDIENINGFIKNLSETMDDFRNFYKPDKVSKSVQLQEVVTKALKIIKLSLVSDRVEIIEEYKDSDYLELYDNELMQVILNIIKNAQDNFKDKEMKNKYIKIKTENKMISICDNGGGISVAILEKIFEPYFSSKNESNGTGLGLYMSKIIVEDHHRGKLSVKNIDDGVCFEIKLNEVTKW